MPDVRDDILSNAVARSAAVVLSLPSAGMLRHHKSRFLSENQQGVWLESVESEHLLIKELIAAGQPCGISFKVSEKKISFTARILLLEPAYRVNERTELPALVVVRPAAIKTLQRRTNYRVKIPGDCEMKLRMWRIPEHVVMRDKPPRNSEVAVSLRDLSVGGLGIVALPKDNQPPKLVEGERVRISLAPPTGDELLLEGRIRSIRPSGDGQSFHTGVHFQKLQDGLEGRQMLTALNKIVGNLQLDEVRRHRLGLE